MLSTAMPYVALLFALAALGISFVAMQFALTNKRDEHDYRRLLLFMTELDDNHEALAASHKRLRSRVGMRELRAKRKNGEDEEPELPQPSRDVDEWKKQMRQKLHTGEVKVR